MTTSVAAIQMVSGNDVETNLARAKVLIAQAAERGAQLLVLPEAFALFISQEQQQLGASEAGPRPRVRTFLAEQAALHKVWIVGGTIPVLDEIAIPEKAEKGDAANASKNSAKARPRAASFLIDASGREVARYDKMHLFDVDVNDKQGSYRESNTFAPGDAVVTVPTPFGCVGMAVCYDLRFPELFQQLRLQGAEVIVVPSAFTRKTGLAHWLPLLRARAIETQCYFIGANQGGEHSATRHTSGGSVIVDSWGTVLAESAFGESVITATIDLEKLKRERGTMPVIQHRRFDIALK
ncbi:MAG: carbon-nitrogen hydrolase [Verrucomicrobiaceae bacterium]|nr:carbon-nitrogen hydrolase [Verrucomicrobiaceae bacterium]